MITSFLILLNLDYNGNQLVNIVFVKSYDGNGNMININGIYACCFPPFCLFQLQSWNLQLHKK